MPNHRGLDLDEGWIKREFRKIRKEMREQAAAKRLSSSTIGAGGVTVKNGGSIASTYPNGAQAGRFGPYYGDPASGVGHGVFLNDENGVNLFGVVRYPDTGVSSFGVAGVDVAAIIGDSVVLYRSDFVVYVSVDAAGVTLGGVGTTGSTANMFIDPSTGLVSRSTSSLRYKQDVEDAEVDPAAVLDMQPRTWRDKAEVEADPDTETRYVGFIAEELHDLGLGQFVVYDADGDPEAISYDRLTVALLAVLKDQEKRIAALEADDA